MLELIILILNIIDKDPDNEVGPLIKDLLVVMRKVPLWERKAEWRKLRVELRGRFLGLTSAVDLLERIRDHAESLQDKLKG